MYNMTACLKYKTLIRLIIVDPSKHIYWVYGVENSMQFQLK